MKEKIGIIGAGRLGSALAITLKRNGACISGISCKDEAESKFVAEKIAVKAFSDNHELAQNSDVIFLTVPDSLITKVAQELLAKGLAAGTVMLHCSGAMSGFALPQAEGIYRGSFHPLQSFAGGNATFEGIFIAMDGDREALPVMQNLCSLLCAKALPIPSQERALYHAAAVFASNYLVTVLAAAEDLFSKWTGEPSAAREAIMPLVNGTLANFTKLGGAKALTGPIARGDSQTISQHLQVIPEELLQFYKNLGLQTLALAEQNGNLTDEEKGKINFLLKENQNGCEKSNNGNN